MVRRETPCADVVSRYDEPADEILDLGRPRRGETASAPTSLPPMHIGDQPLAEDNRTDRPPWWQWLVLVLAIVAALIVGVLGSNARRDAADLAAAESEVDLVAGTPVVVNAENTPFQLPIYNAGPLEVELLWIRPEGWTLADTAATHPVTLRPDNWTTVRVRAVPDCAQFPSPDVLELRVRTQARENEVSLPLPVAGVMQEVRTAACRDFTPVGAFVEEVQLVPSQAEHFLTLRLHMRAFDPSQRFVLTAVEASAPGFGMTHASLPVQFEPGGALSFPLDITWQVVNCEATQILNDVNLGLEFQDENGDQQTDAAALPGRGVAELARFGVAQCGAG